MAPFKLSHGPVSWAGSYLLQVVVEVKNWLCDCTDKTYSAKSNRNEEVCEDEILT